MISDEIYMKRALQLAELGGVHVAPNPLVGAVIVYNHQIIGEGYHTFFGGPHAEVNAVEAVENKRLLQESTIYVTLEPCSHFGKTPPCANLLVECGFKRVVIAMKDPFSKVDGNGIALLQQAEIEVKIGVLEKEAKILNKRFLTFHQKNRPYITLKWAQSKDHFIAPLNSKGQPFWISQPETQILTHQLRATEQAILVGRKTIEVDNPSLTTRAFHGPNPIRIILDPELKIPIESKTLIDNNKTLIFNNLKNENINQITYAKIENFNVEMILKKMVEFNVVSVIVEGGAHTLNQFIESDLWDEALVITGDLLINEGIQAPVFLKKPETIIQYQKDILSWYVNPLNS